jgi:dienelactone hydrolase
MEVLVNLRSVLLAALALSLLPAAPAVGERLTDTRDGLVGWYRFGDGDLRLTYRPGEGLFGILLEKGLSARVLLPEGAEDCFSWGEGGHACFERDGRRVARLFRWRDGSGRRGLAPRLAEPPYVQRQLAFEGGGGVRLVGTLFLPAGEGPWPAAAIIQGAGTSSRSNLWAWTFADGLARRGVAVLLPDKRGSGDSGGDWLSADFEDLAADARAALDVLRAVQGVDAQRVGFVGLSQGGWVAPLAARDSAAAFCAALACSLTGPADQVRHELRRDLQAAGLAPHEVTRLEDVMRRLLRYTRSGEGWRDYREAAEAATSSERTEGASSWFPADPDARVLDFWRGIVAYEPLEHWRAVEAPRLVLLGAQDEADNTPVARSLELLGALYAERPSIDLELRVVPRAGHALEDDRTGWVSQDLLEDLAEWIRRRAAP